MLVRPRLTDHFGILLPQNSLDFAIPFLDEDIPLYLDPFLLWRSPSQQDQALHTSLLNAFNNLGSAVKSGRKRDALETLIIASECDEVGLGSSTTRTGKRIGESKAEEIVSLFDRIPVYGNSGFRHFEEIQFFVEGISKDRISDISCSFLKSFLIDFTTDQAKRLGIPTRVSEIPYVYSYRDNRFERVKNADLPVNPRDDKPLIFVPKRWLRFTPWINYEDYFASYCPQDEISHRPEELTRVEVLNFNRDHYGVVAGYIEAKERTREDAHNDPLFSQIPNLSAKRRLAKLTKLQTGKGEGADKQFEEIIEGLFPSLLYPQLDFAAPQVRTDSGVSIRDLVFYNTRSTQFLGEIFGDYGSRQIVFELKNVAAVERQHIDQMNRYLADEFGRFGVLVTRHPLRNAEYKRTIDLWSGQRKAIIALTDSDVAQMVEIFESKQRDPIDVITKKYTEFRRDCPVG